MQSLIPVRVPFTGFEIGKKYITLNNELLWCIEKLRSPTSVHPWVLLNEKNDRYYLFSDAGKCSRKESDYYSIEYELVTSKEFNEKTNFGSKTIKSAEKAIEKGDVVTLRSGGPKMTVLEIVDNKDAIVCWFLEGLPNTASYPLVAIEITKQVPDENCSR